MHARAARLYKQVDLESSSKTKVLDRLYTRLLADINEAREAIEKSDVSGRANAIDHALRIVTELNAALDFRVAKELCANLAGLYGYTIDRLESANVNHDATSLLQASEVIGSLQESFRLAAEKQ